MLKQFFLTKRSLLFSIFILFLSYNKTYAQVSISNPGCVIAGQQYIYNCQGNCGSPATMTWCISSNGTILQAYGTNITGTGSCRSGTGVGSIYVQWNSSGAGSVTLTSSTGNASPLNFTIANALNPGSITANLTQTIGYNTIPAGISCSVATYGYCTPAYSYQWQQSTDNVTWSNITGQTSQNLSFSTSLLTTTYYRRKVTETNTSVVSYANGATVFVTPPFSSITIAPATQNIYTGSTPSSISGPAATGGNCGGAYGYQWQYSTDGGNTYNNIAGATSLSYSPGVLAQTTHYKRKDTCGSDVSFSTPSVVNVYQHLSAGTLSPSSLTITYNTDPGFITKTSPTGDMCSPNYTYQWQVSADGINFSDISGATTSLNYNPGKLTSTYFFRRKVTCVEVAYSNTVTINVNPQVLPGSIIPGSLAIPSNTNPGTLYSEAASGGACSNSFSYQWQQSADGQDYTFTNIAGATSETYTPGNLTVATYYRRKVTCGIDILYSSICKISILTGAPRYNYVQARNIAKPSIINESSAALLTDPREVNQTKQYFDGLGRIIQTVNRQSSPLSKDIVASNLYDEFGREVIKFLPYVSSADDGKYKATSFVDQNTFYNNGLTDKVADDTKPFVKTRFESSALNRVLEQGAPGNDWQPDATDSYSSADKTIKFAYEGNLSNEVLLWSYTSPTPTYPLGLVNTGTGTTPAYYIINKLFKNKTKDEQNHEVIEFKDKDGKVVLKNVQATAGQWAQTYYIYDDFGNLVCVISPEAVSRLATEYYQSGATDITKNNFLERWAFRYVYDSRNRMAQKQVPGAKAVYMVYDSRDRLVLTQDGNQRTDASGNITKKEWTFTKYDALNRPIITGIYTHGSVLDQGVMQSYVNTQMVSGNQFYEDYNGVLATEGYTTRVFPMTSTSLLTITYYDNYSFRSLWTGSYTYVDDDLSQVINSVTYDQPTTENLLVNGLVTGTKVKVLDGGNTWLKNISYYDDKNRSIQTISDNHKAGVDRGSTLYDFAGKVLKVKTVQGFGTSTQIDRRFEYDPMGRLTKTYHKLGTQSEILLSLNQYNELGQLVDKKLHSTLSSGSDAKQSIDYRYNIRGWLISMNDASLTLDGAEPKDYFGMELGYNTVLTSLGNSKFYNGNISGIKWSNGLGDGDVKEKGYTYKYDTMNRITESVFKEKTSSWGTLSNSVNAETSFGYDLNGNITGLTRNDRRGTGTMDVLVYNYGSGNTLSNKLLKVTDNGDDFMGFIDGTNTGDDYTYDWNGNMLTDQNKGITSNMTYNLLNLPELVTRGNNTVKYIYDATGRKLSQVVTYGGSVKTTDYVGELQHENNTLQFINHEEGRVVVAGTKLVYTNPGVSTTNITASNATITPITLNGEKYIKATSSGTVPRTGMFPFGGTFPVLAGEQYKIRAKGYREKGTAASSNPAYLLVKANGVDVGWPGAALPAGSATAQTESWIEQIITIPVGANALQVGVVWNTVLAGEIMYLNELEIIKLETIAPEYQYSLKDHLGNVRVTFTTKQETDQSLATLEVAKVAAEQAQFIYYDEAVKINAKIFDHTDQLTGTPETPPVGAINLHKEAEAFTAQSGTTVSTGALTSCDNGDWAQYNSINMTGITALKLQCAAAAQSLGRVEVRLGSISGQILGYLQGPNTGSGTAYSGYVIPLAAATGTQNIFLLFKDATGIMNLDWIEFMGPGAGGQPVKGISLLNTSLILSPGQTATLTKIIIPAEATDQSVTWTSSNAAVATVNSSGVVTGVAVGSVLITATTSSGGYTAKAAINVKPADTNMLSNSEFDSGTTSWVLGEWTGAGHTNGGSTFSAVTGAGLSGTNALYVDVVNANNENWTLQPYNVLNFKLEVGKTYEISFMAKAQSARTIGVALQGQQTNTEYWVNYVNPTTTAQTFGPYLYTCTNNTVTANSTFTIAFYLAKGVISDVWIDKVIVKDVTPGSASAPTTGISVAPSASSLSVGQHGEVTPTVIPASALSQVTWTSSNTTVAVVNSSGLVTALAAGTATITAKTIAGNYTASSTLTVTAAGSNSIVNGQFDSGTTNWTLGEWTGAGHTNGGSTFSSVTGAGLSGTNAMYVDVVNANNETWTLQPYNRLNYKLELGRTYEVSFMAKAQSARTMGAALRGEQTDIDIWSTWPTLTTTAQTYGPYQFTCTNNGVLSNSTFTMAFYLARGVISDVWIDNVIVKDITTGVATANGVSISPSRLSLTTGQTGQLTRTIAPSNASNQSVTWTSDNTAVATVNSNGVVSAVSTGTAIITATSADGGFTSKATVSVNAGVTSYSTRLSGTTNERYGLAKSLSVMPGDTIKMEVYAKYLDNNTNNWNAALTNLMTAIAQGIAPTGTFVDGGAAGSIGGTTFPYIGTLPRTGDSGTGPKAYLNYIVFDKNFVFKSGGFKRLSETPKENGTDVPHERLAFDGAEQVVITEPGYVYIYLSNENDTPVEVYFDDFKVEHIKGPIVASQDYYPFGLTFNSYQRENSIYNKYQYNGKEIQNELGLGWLNYGWRMYQPEIARWNAIDQYASIYEQYSPYSFVENNPISSIDYEGKLIVYVNGFRPGDYAVYVARQARSQVPIPAPHDHKENWFYSDTFNYWGDFNESWSFPDNKRYYVDGSNHANSSAGDRFSKGETEGKILADKIKSGEIKLDDAETIKLIGHSMGAAHAMGMAKGLIDAGIDPNLIQVLLFAPHQPNQIQSLAGIFLLQAFRDNDKISGKGKIPDATNSKNERIGNNSEYARMPDGNDDDLGNHGIQTYTAEEFKQTHPKLYQYLIDKKIIIPDNTPSN